MVQSQVFIGISHHFHIIFVCFSDTPIPFLVNSFIQCYNDPIRISQKALEHI